MHVGLIPLMRSQEVKVMVCGAVLTTSLEACLGKCAPCQEAWLPQLLSHPANLLCVRDTGLLCDNRFTRRMYRVVRNQIDFMRLFHAIRPSLEAGVC